MYICIFNCNFAFTISVLHYYAESLSALHLTNAKRKKESRDFQIILIIIFNLFYFTNTRVQ